VRGIGGSGAIVGVAVIGVVISVGLGVAAARAHADNEQRLTDQRAVEVTSVLTAAVPSIEVPLAAAAALVEVESDPTVFEEVVGTQVGPEGRFVSASVWRVGEMTPEVIIGEPPALRDLPPAEVEAFLDRTLSTDLMSVLDLVERSEPRIGYSYVQAGGQAEFVVYAEQALSPDRTSSVPEDEAFSDIEFALYLDTAERSGTLVLASTDELPLDGTTAEDETAFGDSVLRAVVAPRGDLGGELLARLPWLIALTGLVLTAAAAGMTAGLQRRRRQAEALVEENAALYKLQQAGSVALQRSLLPRTLPNSPDLEMAARYSPGVRGTEVGGDWYDVVHNDARTLLVVGDVSGRGLTAASVMAAVRHAIRTLAYRGDSPETILAQVNQPGLVDLEGHFVTVLCVELDHNTAQLRVVSAGHPPPVVLEDHHAVFTPVAVGPPIGVPQTEAYKSSVQPFGPTATVLMFTDGLFERRDEPLDVGLERLRLAVRDHTGNVEDLVDYVFGRLLQEANDDDAALLAVRWAP
jgi:serine phosphatase RsbU (regulator of sigma subunit)